ncbi:hypothetical protein [Helicobacter suis]|uniref:hypothetical protein n=1 Tax=Helicobacter suis TaxID=104628 RepID=UPI00117A65ED|nr:hypothetical protein [Helicobacter suis]
MGFNDVDLRFNAQNDTGSFQQNLAKTPDNTPTTTKFRPKPKPAPAKPAPAKYRAIYPNPHSTMCDQNAPPLLDTNP